MNTAIREIGKLKRAKQAPYSYPKTHRSVLWLAAPWIFDIASWAKTAEPFLCPYVTASTISTILIVDSHTILSPNEIATS